eukprot:TRINITY_DN17630_c0_g1_i1.p1 TRINITY_DN17630_c0_g1~~TRINITY_DN17630_c0_g1_i1.p1  ORF type:complete len:603 (+),score=77.88 TRINITY_DN17630_c0_g1_i1:21-1829(+)
MQKSQRRRGAKLLALAQASWIVEKKPPTATEQLVHELSEVKKELSVATQTLCRTLHTVDHLSYRVNQVLCSLQPPPSYEESRPPAAKRPYNRKEHRGPNTFERQQQRKPSERVKPEADTEAERRHQAELQEIRAMARQRYEQYRAAERSYDEVPPLPVRPPKSRAPGSNVVTLQSLARSPSDAESTREEPLPLPSAVAETSTPQAEASGDADTHAQALLAPTLAVNDICTVRVTRGRVQGSCFVGGSRYSSINKFTLESPEEAQSTTWSLRLWTCTTEHGHALPQFAHGIQLVPEVMYTGSLPFRHETEEPTFLYLSDAQADPTVVRFGFRNPGEADAFARFVLCELPNLDIRRSAPPYALQPRSLILSQPVVAPVRKRPRDEFEEEDEAVPGRREIVVEDSDAERTPCKPQRVIHPEGGLPTFTMLVGIPGSGKSTFAAQQRQKNPDLVVVSTDDIRREIYGTVNEQSKSSEVFDIAKKRVVEALEADLDVILDATNTVAKYRKDFLTRLPACRRVAQVFQVPPCVAKQRIHDDLCRGRDRSAVPPDVVDRMHKQLQQSSSSLFREGFELRYCKYVTSPMVGSSSSPEGRATTSRADSSEQ